MGRHIAIIAPPLRGHLDPLGVLGEELVALGHRVTVVTDAGMESSLPYGLAFRALHLPEVAAGLAARMASTGPGALTGLIGGLARRADALCTMLPAVLDDLVPDLVIADQTEPAGALIARASRLRLVSAAAALPLNREDDLPPPYLGWHYDSGPYRIWLNRGGYRGVDWLMAPVTRVLNRHAKRLGLPPIARQEDLFSDTLQIGQLWPGLDYPRRAAPAHLHLVGPFRRAEDGAVDLGEDSRPLVFCSLGTVQGARADIFTAVAEASERLGLRLLIAHGGRLAPADIFTLSRRAMVRDFMPQRAVLRQAAMAVVHGGLNTVLDAASLGVPMVVVPIAFDQAAIAARVSWRGVGLSVGLRHLDRELEPAMRRVRDEPSFRQVAEALAREARHCGGARRAAALVDGLLAGTEAVADR